MNDKRRIFILSKILDKIQEDNENLRKVEESYDNLYRGRYFF